MRKQAEIATLNDVPDELKSKLSDLAPSGFAALMALMGWGPLGTIVSKLVPNQRLDRVAVFCGRLQAVVESLSFRVEALGQAAEAGEAPERIELLLEGLERAARATSATRAQLLAHIVAQGISQDEVAAQKARTILGSLHELTDIELTVLLYFYRNVGRSYSKVGRTTISEQLGHEPAVASIFENDVGFWIACTSRLEGRGLIRKSSTWGGEWGDEGWPDQKRESAEYDPSHFSLTSLGKLLAEQLADAQCHGMG